MTSNIHNIYKYILSINAPIFTCHMSFPTDKKLELSQDILNVKAIGHLPRCLPKLFLWSQYLIFFKSEEKPPTSLMHRHPSSPWTMTDLHFFEIFGGNLDYAECMCIHAQKKISAQEKSHQRLSNVDLKLGQRRRSRPASTLDYRLVLGWASLKRESHKLTIGDKSRSFYSNTLLFSNKNMPLYSRMLITNKYLLKNKII